MPDGGDGGGSNHTCHTGNFSRPCVESDFLASQAQSGESSRNLAADHLEEDL